MTYYQIKKLKVNTLFSQVHVFPLNNVQVLQRIPSVLMRQYTCMIQQKTANNDRGNFMIYLLGYQSGKYRIHWILLISEVVVNVFSKGVNKYLRQTERVPVDKVHACQRTESVHPYNSRCI